MGCASNKQQQIYHCFRIVFIVLVVGFSVTAAHQCNYHHDYDNHHHHRHDHVHQVNGDVGVVKKQQQLLPEEISEAEDLKLYGYGLHHNHGYETEHKHGDVVELSGLGLWLNAMGCSLLVSLASLICLIILPIIFIQGKPSKAVVDSLALFGAGAMLGDAFLHQLPHAFGGEHSHSHDDNTHGHMHVGESHSHSLRDLSVGLSVLAGIVPFLLVEKLERDRLIMRKMEVIQKRNLKYWINCPLMLPMEINKVKNLFFGREMLAEVILKIKLIYMQRTSPMITASQLVEKNLPRHSQIWCLVISTSSPMEYTILLMEWLWEVLFSFMDQLVVGQELCFCLLMSFLRR